MNTIDILNKEFFGQDFAKGQPYAEILDRYRGQACCLYGVWYGL